MQPPGDIGGVYIGPGHQVSKAQEQFGNAAHADAADSHKMNMIIFLVHEYYLFFEIR